MLVGRFVPRQAEPGVTVVECSGQLTLGNTLSEIEHGIKQLIEQGSKKLVLDLTRVSFIDSAGAGTLAFCGGWMERSGGWLVICGASGKVKQTLELVHLDRVVGMYPDVSSACSALGKVAESTAPEVPQAPS